MLDAVVLERLLNLTYVNEKGILSNTLQLMGNLLAGEEESQLITDAIPIVTRIIELFKTNLSDYDVFFWMLDIVYKLLLHDGGYYIHKLSELIGPLIECKDNILNEKLLLKLLQTYNALTKYSELEHIKIILNKGMAAFVFKYMNDKEIEFSKLALSIIGNIMASTQNEDTDIILKMGYLECIITILRKMISVNDYSCIYIIAWSISNICAGSKEQIEQVLNSDILTILISIVDTHNDVKFYIELIFIFQNCMIFGDDSIRIQLTHHIIINFFDKCLRLCKTDKSNPVLNKLAYECMNTIRNYLFELGKLDDKSHFTDFKTKINNKDIPICIDDYQMHPDKTIAGMANITIAGSWDFSTLYEMGIMNNDNN
jgi:hypothetical protein